MHPLLKRAFVEPYSMGFAITDIQLVRVDADGTVASDVAEPGVMPLFLIGLNSANWRRMRLIVTDGTSWQYAFLTQVGNPFYPEWRFRQGSLNAVIEVGDPCDTDPKFQWTINPPLPKIRKAIDRFCSKL